MSIDQLVAIGFPEVLIPLTVIGGPIVAVIVGIFAKHQQKMAELYMRQAQAVDPRLIDEVRALRSEVADLKDRVNQQVLSTEAAAELNRQYLAQTPPLAPVEAIEERSRNA